MRVESLAASREMKNYRVAYKQNVKGEPVVAVIWPPTRDKHTPATTRRRMAVGNGSARPARANDRDYALAMCGRVIRTSPVELLKQLFDLASAPKTLPERYNLAPTDPIPVIRRPRELELLRWGLEMPDARMAGTNARVESLSKPIYREKLRDKRCLVVTDGFYEWRSVGGKKQPYVIAREDGAPIVMAGIYDSSGGCAILTAPSRGIVATLHQRMPVILAPSAFDAWIDPAVKDVRAILAEANADGLISFPVSTRVNSVRKDDPMLLERVPEPVDEEPKGKTLSLF